MPRLRRSDPRSALVLVECHGYAVLSGHWAHIGLHRSAHRSVWCYWNDMPTAFWGIRLIIAPVQCQESFDMVSVRTLLDGVFANEGAKGEHEKKVSNETIKEMIELGQLKEALEALKSDYPEVINHLGELTNSEKAYQRKTIDFAELGKIKARLQEAALDIVHSRK